MGFQGLPAASRTMRPEGRLRQVPACEDRPSGFRLALEQAGLPRMDRPDPYYLSAGG